MWTRTKNPLLTYGFAVVSVALVLGGRYLAWTWLHDESPFLFFITAIALSAWWGGFYPGLLSTALSSAVVALVLLNPVSASGTDVGRVAQLASFAVIGLLTSWLMARLHASRVRAETAQKEAAERASEAEAGKRVLEALLKYIPQGIAIADAPDGKVREISEFWCSFVGQTRNEIVGIGLENLLERRHEVRSAGQGAMSSLPLLQAIRSAETVTSQEWTLKRADGKTVPVLCNAGPIRDQDGHVTAGIISWHDISVRRQAEQQLRAAHAELEDRVSQRTAELARTNRELDAERHNLFTLLDTFPFFVCLLARDHSIQFTNRAFRELFPSPDDRPPHSPDPHKEGIQAVCPACQARDTESQRQWDWTSSSGRHYEIYDLPFFGGGSDGLVLEIGVDITERKEAERGIERERNKLMTILTSMPEAVYIINQHHELQFINPAFEREFGPVLPGRKCFEQLHGRSDACHWCPAAEIMAGRSTKWEWDCAKNGKIYDVFEAPVFNHDESLSKIKILHDVTEHMKVQERLRRNEELMRKTLETLPVGVWFTDRNGVIQSGNPRATEIWGGARYVGKDGYGEYVAWHTDTGKRVQPDQWALSRVLKTGTTIINEEVEIQAFDGTRKIILNSAAPVRNESGDIIAGISVNQDISELKRAEREQARQHRQLKSLAGLARQADLDFASLYDHVLREMLSITDSRYGLIGFPSEDGSLINVHSWSPEVFRDCGVSDKKLSIVNGGLWARALDTLTPVILNGYSPGHPDARGFPEGHIHLDRVLIVPVASNGKAVMIVALANKEQEYTKADAEQVLAFLTSANTIVARKKAEEALRLSESELRRLSSELLTAQENERLRISRELHDDLGQTLMLVKLRLGLLEMGLGPENSSLLDHCCQAAASIDQTIDSIRRLSRDLCPAVLEDVGLSAALDRLVSDTAKASRIQIRTELEDLGSLFTTQSSIFLYRVFQETLNNIVKHADATEVEISARRRNGSIAFEIRDNGKGMEPESASAGSSGERRGLGLSFVKERIRTLGGSMEIWSQKGKGTRLMFTVPVHEKRGAD
jgi:PAS domain S-box-containing protein